MRRYLFQLTVLFFAFPLTALSQLTFTLESGVAFTQYNDVRTPNKESQRGSLFSLVDNFQDVQTPIYFRAEAKYLLNSKHTFEITAVPLTVKSEDFSGNAFLFEDEIFAGDGIIGNYQFNTYRTSYRYRLVNRSRFLLDVGATLLIRDAAITISQNDRKASNTDLGFVPLISINAEYKIKPKLITILKGDALVGSAGRAEDFFLGLQYLPSEKAGIKAGYRIIEGGADVDQVYNFALFHFASIGLTYTL